MMGGLGTSSWVQGSGKPPVHFRGAVGSLKEFDGDDHCPEIPMGTFV